jgi:biotin transporter BioY
LVIFTLGLTWLSRFVGIDAALAGGLYPFVLGDLVKVALAAALLPSGWAIIRHLTR